MDPKPRTGFSWCILLWLCGFHLVVRLSGRSVQQQDVVHSVADPRSYRLYPAPSDGPFQFRDGGY